MLSALSLLLAVTSAVQAPPAPAHAPRARRARPPVSTTITVAPLADLQATLEAAAATLEMAQPDLAALAMQAPVMAMAAADLQSASVTLSVAPMALVGPAIATTIAPMPLSWNDDEDDVEPAEPSWPVQSQSDVADSVYRAARQALNQNDYERAAGLFHAIRDRYPRSTYVPNTYYWEAFALYRTGADDNLRAARKALQTQTDQYPRATTRRDAQVLLRRVQGELARRGDRDAAASIAEDVDQIAPVPAIAATPPVAVTPAPADRAARAAARAQARAARGSDRDCDDEDDIRIAALNAVLQMDPDRAVPLLKTVLARRDDGSACLRRKAVWLVSQKRSDETSRILLDAVRNDPDQEVREQAVFWLSQVPGDETVAALDSILEDPKTDPDVQEKAIFALSQHRSPRAATILCTYAGRRDRPAELRDKAIFWIGQRHGADSQQCLRDLYKTLDNQDLKEKVIFSVSQMGGADNYRWLMDIALDSKEDIELRKKALFWAGQGHSVDVADLVRLYDSMNDREMKQQLIFVYSQRREEAAVTKLCQIGKTDPDRDLRKKAVFWLGQSRSTTASQCLQELINQ
jgi:TolA-binding protein